MQVLESKYDIHRIIALLDKKLVPEIGIKELVDMLIDALSQSHSLEDMMNVLINTLGSHYGLERVIIESFDGFAGRYGVKTALGMYIGLFMPKNEKQGNLEQALCDVLNIFQSKYSWEEVVYELLEIVEGLVGLENVVRVCMRVLQP